MIKYDYLIIGGGIAGVTAAETVREQDPDASIGIICNEEHPLYSRVLLPSYLKRRIPREQLFLRRIDDFTRRRIDLRLKEEVSFVDVKRREIGLTNQLTLSYHKLLIATGGRVAEWGLPEDQNLIYRLQTLNDADRLFNVLSEIKNPVVVGGSFISMEFLEIFTLNNIVPALLVRQPNFLDRVLDSQGSEMLRDNFEKHNVKVQFNDSVSQIAQKDGKAEIITKGLRKITADALALGIGLERNVNFLRGSEIVLGKNGVRTNEFLETSQEGVFAAGDVAEYYDAVLGVYRTMGTWNNAFLQGKIAGLNMAGKREPFKNISTYALTNLGFQITILGECDSSLESTVRVEHVHKYYERLFIKDGVLVGAALLNRFSDKIHLAKLIESHTAIDSYRDKLGDFEFDIHNIPVVT